LFLVIKHFTKGKEVFLTDAQGEFPHRIAEDTGEIPFDMLQRVDPVAIDVELGDNVLVDRDQGVAHRKRHYVGRCYLGEIGAEFLKTEKIPDCTG